ncbi:hypothetical protein GXW83_21885 [Streptacidiphilus sp. PB12-B1b]|uniref:hypothetical protein n=1 Tax=Streptacidiphilus sp. PB12-B1b TaxID=2705012 RepID=UPI0015FC4F58|nr:hypothetical protein [Streptacidiphilus sp. PB12-B1b]QMU77951.1 hypothetical protein GXW83_21885 [Streptacidiphilus sp. PB12-B1b]
MAEDDRYELPVIGPGEPRPQVESAEVRVGGTALAAAARLARQQSAGPDGPDFPDDPDGFALVARDRYPAQAERALGVPFLQQGVPGGPARLPAERLPGTDSANRAAWLSGFLTQAAHGAAAGAARGGGNPAVRAYLDALTPDGE